MLHIKALGVDDRAVIKLNDVKITSVGTTANGNGNMQFRDPGNNRRYNFQFKAGPVSFIDKTDLRPGYNELKVIVNNTDQGIQGTLQPVTQQDPSFFGMDATITYTNPR